MTKEEFIEKLRNSASSPFLFLGAGFSRHYLGAPQWKDLLKEQVPVGKHINQYASILDNPDDLTMVASAIAKDVNEEFWRLEVTDPERLKYQDKANTNSYVLKARISDKLKAYDYEKVIADYREEIELLRSLNIDGVITTNYDLLADKIFDKYKVYIGQQQLISSSSMAIGEIYKIHGCISDPHSLVLTKEDYDLFEQKNPCLAAKLLTIFMEHPIIFMGYSLSDPDIQHILDSIVKCTDTASISRLQDNLIFVNWIETDTENFTIDSASLTMLDGKILPVTKVNTHYYKPLYECLAHYEQRIPVHILRLLKEHFYDIILSQKPTKKIYAMTDLDAANIHNVQFVYGVGVISKVQTAVGYTGLKPVDIYRDVLTDGEYDALSILQKTIPDINRRFHSVSLPMYKYLRDLGINDQESLDNNTLDIHIEIKHHTLADFQTYKFKEEEKRKTLDDVIANYDATGWKTVALIPYLNIQNSDLSKLCDFILTHLDDFFASKKSKFYNNSTYMRKLICYYDWRMYGWES